MVYEVFLSYKVSAANEAEAKRLGLEHIKVKEVAIAVSHPLDIFQRMEYERKADREHFVVFHLNTQNEIIHKEVVTIGTLNASLVHPREVFRSAVVGKCNSVIVSHNHPSGSLEPSEEDIRMTERLQKAGYVLGIGLTDHIIVGERGYTSFRERGLI